MASPSLVTGNPWATAETPLQYYSAKNHPQQQSIPFLTTPLIRERPNGLYLWIFSPDYLFFTYWTFSYKNQSCPGNQLKGLRKQTEA